MADTSCLGQSYQLTYDGFSQLPWDDPTYACQEYCNWKDCKITLSPGNKIDTLALCLGRYPSSSPTNSPAGTGPFKRMCSGASMSPTSGESDSDLTRICSSQPELAPVALRSQTDNLTSSGEDLGPVTSFSQPLHPDHMLLSSTLLSQNRTTISFKDKRGMPLVFKACLVEMGENLLLDFRLSKGDGLEFKRQ